MIFMQLPRKSGGFVHLILLIIIAAVVLGLFGFNLQKIIQSPVVQENLSYIWSFVVSFWSNYLERPFVYIWEHLFKPWFGDNAGQLKEAFLNNGDVTAAPGSPAVNID